MSVLDEQLKELQGRKLKVEFFLLLKSSLGDVSTNKFKDVEKEIKDELFAFIDAQIGMIEDGEIKSKSEVEGLFSSNEVETLKLLINKVQNKTSNESPYEGGTPPVTPLNPVLNKQDKISFALAHQKLGGKEVRVTLFNGDKAHGTVTGLDAPYIGVTLANGEYVKVFPKDILL